MGELQVFSEKEAKAAELDTLYDEMSAFVCENGPHLLTRGMNPIEANRAILECMKHLLSNSNLKDRMLKDCNGALTNALQKLQIANDIVERLRFSSDIYIQDKRDEFNKC